MPSDGLILGFDTSAAHCAAALLSGTRILAERVEPMARGQAERLMPLLQEVLDDAGAGWGDLTRIGVGIGPGNFTGIRIAVSAARGLSLGLGIPAVGVDTLRAAALDAPRPALAAVPATGGRFYLGRFDAAGAMTTETLAPEGMPEGPILSYARDTLPAQTAPAHSLAVAIARLAGAEEGDIAAPDPLYLRPADAAPARDAPPVMLD